MKQVILVRQDLKLPKGKLAAQVAHASLEAALKTNSRKRNNWRAEGGKKIVLKVRDLKELLEFQKKTKTFKTALITDAGYTTLKPGTTTCLGIGPEKEEKIDRITGHLKML